MEITGAKTFYVITKTKKISFVNKLFTSVVAWPTTNIKLYVAPRCALMPLVCTRITMATASPH